MSYSPLTSKLFKFTALTVALALAGCGGDGTDTVAPPFDGGNNGGQTGGDNGNGQQPVEALNITSSKLLNVDGDTVTTVNLDGAYYEVIVTDANNKPIANTKVSFSIDAQGIVLSQTTSGSSLTDSEGKARIFLKPSAPEVSGAYTITATATNESNTAVNNLTFSVQATDVTFSALTVEKSLLPSGGQTKVSFKVSDTAGNPLSGILTNLNSSCGQLPTQMSSDSDGMIEVVYKAINSDNTLCSGNVRISASTGNKVQSANITVEAPEANSIVFTSDSFRLGAQNSGSSATGIVEFTVYSNNIPLANQAVKLTLNKAPFDLTFGVLGNRSERLVTTDENGQVSIQIYPGVTPGPVEIKATLVSDPNINALSKGIFIDSSRVTQDGLSLSFGANVLDWGADGDVTSVAARMVDRNGNKVPDGTIVSFTAEGGKVFPSSCGTVNGECSVEFSTQNPRPGDGRVSLLAVAEGEKTYIDQNENNAWDEGIDTLVHNIGDTFRDDNENGTFEIGEFTYPLTTQATGQCENNIKQFINLKFPSSSDEVKEAFEKNFISTFVSPNKPMTCNTELSTVVRHESIQLLSNGSNARFMLLQPSSQVITGADKMVNVRINSGGFYDLNPMPSGTTITGSVVDKTKSNPVATIIPATPITNGFVISITDANSNATIKVKKGDTEFTVNTNAQGNGRTSAFIAIPDGDISIEQENLTCTVEFVAGFDKVPGLVNPGKPGDNTGTVNTYALDKCQAGDFFKISATSPKNSTTTQTYVIQ
ncbi:Ig-like domain-containing protein [Psychrobacter sp. M13]|uniref:Ig-like domain-containing protein n=1 Tax=Psychrobacter sp. M13 TaxID=3067275 RepID=UPI00273BEA37|nr:Ig-like domain-containing protein [Psychrobacter sp. M13]WLP93998.1 Ig-like domain-containing protein [Psychrobacter sp. M13]